MHYRWNLEAMRTFEANSWLFSFFGKFAGLRDGSRWKISVRLPLSGRLPAMKEKQIYGCFSPSVNLLGFAMENIREICELKFPLGRRCGKAMDRATIKYALGEISRWWELLKQIYGYVCSFGPTWFQLRTLPREANTETTWSRGIRGNLHLWLRRKKKRSATGIPRSNTTVENLIRCRNWKHCHGNKSIGSKSCHLHL